MDYVKPKFNVVLGSEKFRDGWERTFGRGVEPSAPEAEHGEASAGSDTDAGPPVLSPDYQSAERASLEVPPRDGGREVAERYGDGLTHEVACARCEAALWVTPAVEPDVSVLCARCERDC